MIPIEVARELLDFGKRIGPGQRADEQLEGAVAVHNILQSRKVAYLADEVGMGKTYVALGALALFRHFKPGFRVLVIAPRENIQRKWMKELRNFVAHNVRFADLRVKALDGTPAVPLVSCENLPELLGEAALNPDRDFFARLTSFSVPLSGEDQVAPERVRALRDSLRRHLPWLDNSIFDLRNKKDIKDNFAQAVCCGLPTFDLVIVDEAHNLKNGFKEGSAARNRVLALAFGHPRSRGDRRLFSGYGPRAERVLFLSATPIEETYRHLWNQLDVFGMGQGFEDLAREDVGEEEKKRIASQFLVRRVTQIRVGGQKQTKNLYRREWRSGGVHRHDEPIRVTDPRQRLVVALVQKKVSEILGQARFNGSFQIGMLASFESFLETAKLRPKDKEISIFDDAEQTDVKLERDGLDVHQVNRMARDYRKHFGTELPHPKMDAVVAGLQNSWRKGWKTLLFVRRVASVRELKRRLDDLYDEWLMDRLRRDLPGTVRPRLDKLIEEYQRAKTEVGYGRADGVLPGKEDPASDDCGGTDTFFAWFFRGDGPSGVVSGANVQQRFTKNSSWFSTFFARNHVAELLQAPPGRVIARLAKVLGVSDPELRNGLRRRAARFLSRAARVQRGDRFEAAQAAAIEWLRDQPGSFQESAIHLWQERFQSSVRSQHSREAPDVADDLEVPTFFTELILRPELRMALWPPTDSGNLREDVREAEQRAQLLATAARLGHGFIDFYVLIIRRLGSLEARQQEVALEGDEDDELNEKGRIEAYLDLLEEQWRIALSDREWGVFDELAEISRNFHLILDVNAPEAREKQLSETARMFGALLRQQQPVGGMYGQVNQTLVRQFRMPGYPFVLCTTDLLQEGEDLHTFCSSVQHYGISWTPSSMEQRIGRIDRVRSQTDRRLSQLDRPMNGDEMLQVYYPYLEDTIEILQVQRVLERINTFLRLMHEGLQQSTRDEKKLNVGRELLSQVHIPPPITLVLESAFPVRAEFTKGTRRNLAVARDHEQSMRMRFENLRSLGTGGLEITWDDGSSAGRLQGTVRLGTRSQPFWLVLGSIGEHMYVHGTSPVGRTDLTQVPGELAEHCVQNGVRLAMVDPDANEDPILTVNGDLLLMDEQHDLDRVQRLVGRIVRQADNLEQWLLPGNDASIDDFQNLNRTRDEPSNG